MVDIAKLRFSVETGDIKKAIKELDKLEKEGYQVDKSLRNAGKGVSTFKNKIALLIKTVTGLYIAKKAFDGITYATKSFLDTASQFEQYSNRMSAFTTSLKEQNSEMLRARQFAKQYNQDIAKTTETLLLMKNYGLDASNESLKVYTNTALGAGKSIEQFAEAMADALTGENERLKEFGVKASLLGDKVGYAWTDSSGKARNIIIQNNKDIIDSTLRAIFNEKYVGQIEAYKISFAGMTQKLKNIWTNFKLNLADEGLFSYFKALYKVGIGYIGGMFKGNKDEAKSFTETIKTTAEFTIKALAYGASGFDAFKLGLKVVRVGFAQFGVLASEVMQGISNISAKVINAIYGFWVEFGNKVRKIWHDIASYAGNVWNSLVGSISNSSFGKFAGEKLGIKFDALKVDIKPFKASKKEFIAEAKDFSEQIRYWEESLVQNKLDEIDLIDSLQNGERFKQAESAIAKINKEFANIAKTDKSIAKAKEEARKKLEELGAGYGALSKSADKAHKKGVKGAKAHEKALKDAQKQVEKLKKSYEDIFKGGIGSIFKGDFKGGFSSIFSGLGDKLLEPLKNQFSSYLTKISSSILGSFSGMTGSWITLGIKAIGSLFSNKLTEAEIQAGKGRSEFNSQYWQQTLELSNKYAKDGNSIAIKQLAKLRSMDKSLQSFGRGLASSKGGFRLDGKDMTDSHSKGFLGFSEEHKQALGSGIEIATQRVGDLTKHIKALGYQSYKVSSSSFWGLFNNESIDTKHRGLSSAMLKSLQKTVNTTLDSVTENLKTLGFDTTKFKEALQQQIVKLGKINFKDVKDPQQQQQVLQNAISEMLGDAVGNALAFTQNQQLLQSLYQWQKAGEDILTTTSRVAIGFKQVNTYLHIFGQSLTDLNQSQELIQAAGGLEAFTSGMQTFVQNFLSSAEQKEFLKYQLQNALAVWNVALPASKAQFKALVQETQAKIMATKAQIQTLKAEIVAKVKAGEMSLKVAYGEVQGKAKIANQYAYVAGQMNKTSYSLVGSANNAGAAMVGFGNNIHRTVEGIKTGVVNAVKTQKEYVEGVGEIDYSKITSPAIQALEGQLNQLDGVYGTLMSQMGSFASYYNDSMGSMSSATNSCGNSAKSAADKIKELNARLLDIANIRADWTGDKVQAAKIKLKATIDETGLKGLNYDNFLDKFNKMVAKGTPDRETLDKWKAMSSAIKELYNVQHDEIKKTEDIFVSFLGKVKDLANNTNNILNNIINKNDINKSFTQERLALEMQTFDSYFKNGALKKSSNLDDVLNSYKIINDFSSKLIGDNKDLNNRVFNSLTNRQTELLSLKNIKRDDPRLQEQKETNDKLKEVIKELKDIKTENRKLRAEYERLRRESA